MHSSPPAHNLLRLIAQQQGRDLDQWVQKLRGAGVSWRAISNLIEKDYGQSVSVWTLARWYSSESSAA